LIGWLANTPILLIILYRPEYTHRWGSKSFYTTIRVDQLSLPTSAELVQSILSEAEMVPELKDLILGKAAGNPLFMEELTHSLLENGSISKKYDHYVLVKRPADIEVPDTIQGIIAARIDRLDEGLKRIMHVASVIGREFAFRILQSITEMKEDLKGHLLNLQGLELIYEKRLFPELEYIFKHALTQEVAYNSLLLARRKEIHGRIGDAIEDLYPDRLEEFYEMLAYHYSKSTELAKGIDYGKKAAARAASVYAYPEAASLLEGALAVQEVLDPHDKALRCDLLTELGKVLIEAGEARRALDTALPEAFTLAEAIGDKTRASRACGHAITGLRYWASVRMDAWGTPEAAQWVERADRYAEADTVARIWADSSKGDMYCVKGLHTGDPVLLAEGVLAFDRALDLARRLGDQEAFWDTAVGWLMYCRAPHRFEQRFELVKDLAERSREGVTALIVGTALALMGDVFLEQAMRERAEVCLGEMRALAERTGQAHLSFYPMLADGVLATLDGRLEKAMEIASRIRKRGKELGLSEFAAVMESMCGLSPLLLLGKVDQTIQVLSGVWVMMLPLYGTEAEAILFLDRWVAARPGIGTTEDQTFVWVDTALLEAAVRLRHRETVELLFRRLISSAPFSTGFVGQQTCIARHLGAAAALLAMPEEARVYYRQAMDVAYKLRFRPEIALTRLQLAELLLEHYPDEKAEALGHLDFAIGELREMKMQPALERALKQRENLKV
jgi:hypothetical protein